MPSDVLLPRMADKLVPPQRSQALASPKAGAPPAAEAASSDSEKKKLPYTMIRLNNNAIESALPLYRVLETFLLDVTALCSIDLSFNGITAIGPAFKRLPNLKRLYLHCNAISLLSEAENLQANRQLSALTLHGNPVTEKDNYRTFGELNLLLVTTTVIRPAKSFKLRSS